MDHSHLILCVSLLVAGKMDDVLDSLCTLHLCRDIHRHILQLLVSLKCATTFNQFVWLHDIFPLFICRFPFYYEIKVLLVLWLLSPATKGSSILYRKFVHPMLSRHEQVTYCLSFQNWSKGYKVTFVPEIFCLMNIDAC